MKKQQCNIYNNISLYRDTDITCTYVYDIRTTKRLMLVINAINVGVSAAFYSLTSACHRWNNAANDLQDVYDNLTGDVLISAGVIAYLGAFTAGFRQECTKDWSKLCKVRTLSYFLIVFFFFRLLRKAS